MSVGHTVETRADVIAVTEWMLENDLILCRKGRRAYAEAVLRELQVESVKGQTTFALPTAKAS